MDGNSQRLLEFHKIKDGLKECAQSNLGKRLIDNLQPSVDPTRVRLLLSETTEARVLVKALGSHPLLGLHDISECLDRVEKGGILHPEDLVRVADVQRGAARVKKHMKAKRSAAPYLSAYAESITDLNFVSEIDSAVAGNVLADSASPTLGKIRSQMRIVEERIKGTLQSLVTSARLRDAIQDGYISQKSGHYVVAIKASHRHALPGAVIATSGSGSTVFIEPESVRRHCDELRMLEAREEAEEYQILVALTGLIAENLRQISINVEVLAAYDFIFARARYAELLDAVEPEVLEQPMLDIRNGRHPLLGRDAVPLNLRIGDTHRALVITGPNTGGKTVVLKTAGLLCLMSQCGLHVPADAGTKLGVFREILADIGDAQSIENSLSTFSAHMGNIARMMNAAGHRTFVLMDEIGTGTDPAEGAALGCAVLVDLCRRGALSISTTHYGDIKRFAESQPGFINGCMEFDSETLRPLYTLTVGKAGESNAFWIAKNLGFSDGVLNTARQLIQRPHASYKIEHARDATVVKKPGRAGQNPSARRAQNLAARRPREKQFLLGDCVFVHTVKARGVVAGEEDERGNLIVRVRGKNLSVNHTRLSLIGKREDIYPDNYDLEIVLLSKDDRKLARLMRRRLTDAVRIIEPGKDEKP